MRCSGEMSASYPKRSAMAGKGGAAKAGRQRRRSTEMAGTTGTYPERSVVGNCFERSLPVVGSGGKRRGRGKGRVHVQVIKKLVSEQLTSYW